MADLSISDILITIPSIHVIQVIDGAATVVGAKTVQCAPGYEITEPKNGAGE